MQYSQLLVVHIIFSLFGKIFLTMVLLTMKGSEHPIVKQGLSLEILVEFLCRKMTFLDRDKYFQVEISSFS